MLIQGIIWGSMDTFIRYGNMGYVLDTLCNFSNIGWFLIEKEVNDSNNKVGATFRVFCLFDNNMKQERPIATVKEMLSTSLSSERY